MSDVRIVHGRLGSDIWANTRLMMIGDMVKGSGKRILDLGCGPGYIGSMLSEGNDVVFADLEPENLAGIEGERVLLDARSLPFRKGSFDYVVCGDMLEHVREDGKILDGIREVLKDGGRAVITVPAHSSLYGAHDRYIGHYRRYDRGGFARMAREHGFAVEQARYANSLMFPLFLLSNLFLSQTRTYRGKSKNIRKFVPLIRAVCGIERRLRAPFGVSLIFLLRKDGE